MFSQPFLIKFVLLELDSTHFKGKQWHKVEIWLKYYIVIKCFVFFRSFIYPFWIRKTTPTPFLIFLAAFLFCITNGYMQGEYHLHVARYPISWFHSLQFVFGSFLFFLGFIVNVHSDYVVTHLRKPGESGYKIPQGK